MAAAACAAGGVLTLVLGAGAWAAVLAGSLGPLAAAAVTWIIVSRTHRREPGRVAAAMVRLFAAKMLFFGAYVVAALLLLPVSMRAFVVSFTSQYITLHFMEAWFLRRLFAARGERPAD